MPQRRPNRTLGPGHDDFWAWCEKGELRLPKCDQCGHLAWPVVSACEQCGGERFTWQHMSGRGKIVSWCTFEYDYYRGAIPVPYDTILVELEEGAMFISNPAGLSANEIAFEMPVKVEFLACEDAAGAFQLPVFGRR